MADILHELVIEAPPEKVYQAITAQDDLRQWWTTRVNARAEVGSVAEFGFEGGHFTIKMAVTKLDPNQYVGWNVEQGAPDWNGTTATWDLSADDKGTKIVFGHRGFGSTAGSFASTNYSWGWYLTSLKNYLETGEGSPHNT